MKIRKINKYFVVLVLALAFFKIDCLAQVDSSIIETPPISNFKKQYPTINIVRHFYRNNENVQIVKEHNRYYKIEYYSSGEKKSQAEVKIVIAENHILMPDSVEQDSMPRELAYYDIEFQKKGSYTEWYKSGTIKTTGYYYWGDQDKLWKYYDEKGKLLRKKKWKHDG